ncbi:Arp complex subunit [Spiromyces aspiralis]|uniref:Arp complex subunit n=1 Tax=Spiromyces aspiralis TaxID=68401 RepID=A0ACC1HUZ2_9FUNG|nr:Arp complex subunit [Spiromyces aspiralis]
MILLEPDSYVLEKSLLSCFMSAKREVVDIKLVDFDNVVYHLATPDNELPSVLTLSVQLPCYSKAVEYGAGEILQREYGEYLSAETRQGYDVTFRFDLDQVGAEEAERLARKLSSVKRRIISAPFERAIEYWESKPENAGPLMGLPYREKEELYVQAHADRITVIFSVLFKEEMDQVFGRVFLQEFVDVRRQGVLPNAPQVLYSNREPPLEIREVVKPVAGENRGYVTFILTPRHFADAEVREKTVSQIPLFRDYLQYHIKCAKAYMHSRMRTRVSEFLKVLNRAKPDHSTTAEKRTAR